MIISSPSRTSSLFKNFDFNCVQQKYTYLIIYENYSIIAKIRTASSKTTIVANKWDDLELSQELFSVCDSDGIEFESHFLFKFLSYHLFREPAFKSINGNYKIMVSVVNLKPRLHQLFPKNLLKYIIDFVNHSILLLKPCLN